MDDLRGLRWFKSSASGSGGCVEVAHLPEGGRRGTRHQGPEQGTAHVHHSHPPQRKRIEGTEKIVEAAVRAGGVNVFPGWEFYAPVAGADSTIFDLIPAPLSCSTNPINSKQNSITSGPASQKSTSAAASAISVRPEDLYLAPEDWWQKTSTLPGADIEHLGITRSLEILKSHFLTPNPRPASTAQFPRCCRKSRNSIADGKRVLFAVPNTGEVERLADVFTEYNVSFRLGSRTRGGESYADETSLLRRESPHHHARQGLCPRRRPPARSQSRHLRRARSLR